MYDLIHTDITHSVSIMSPSRTTESFYCIVTSSDVSPVQTAEIMAHIIKILPVQACHVYIQQIMQVLLKRNLSIAMS